MQWMQERGGGGRMEKLLLQTKGIFFLESILTRGTLEVGTEGLGQREKQFKN